MATELYTNLGSTTVSAGGTTAPAPGTTETWTVVSSASFPAAVTGISQFHVVDDDPTKQTEIILVTNVSGSSWSVTRGAEGTTPVTHTTGFPVAQILPASVLPSNKLTVSPTANPPASPAVNDLWIVSDAPGQTDTRGYVGHALTTVAVTLNATTGVFTTFTGTNVTAPTLPGERRYKVTVHAKFNMATGTNGLYRLAAFAGATAINILDGTVSVTVIGGPGQVSTETVGTYLVPASTSVTFAAGAARAAGGGTTDAMTQAFCFVEDIGPS